MENTNQMNQKNLNLSKPFVAAKDVVSRRNQDGTVILMKMDNNNVFYKLDGRYGLLWGALQTAVSLDVLKRSCEIFENSDEIAQNQQMVESFVLALGAREMIQETETDPSPEKDSEVSAILQKCKDQAVAVGAIKDFNIDQIEKEVLNDSIYLDVFAGSDLSLKKDFSDIENALQKIMSLDGVHFHWNSSDQSTAKQTGVIAQQVAEQMPELVRRDQDTGHLAVNYTKMIPYLIESIKELNLKVETQASEIRQLKAMLQQ